MAPPRIDKHLTQANAETISSRVTKRNRPSSKPASDALHTTTARRQPPRPGKEKNYAFPKFGDSWQRWAPPQHQSRARENTKGREAVDNSTKSAASDLEVLDSDDDDVEVTQDTPEENETTFRSDAVVLKISAKRFRRFLHERSRQQSSGDHAVLGLEAFLGELNEDDADEARAIFEVIRRNFEKGRDNKRHIDWLIRLFAPAKQRLQKLDEEYAGLAREIARKMARVSQSLRLFDDVDKATDSVDINE